jgi:hypothetical protein
MSVTVDRPADFPALFRSADRESGGFQIGGGLAFLAFACALGAELFLATTSPLAIWYEGRAEVGQSEPKLFVVVSNNSRNRNFD